MTTKYTSDMINLRTTNRLKVLLLATISFCCLSSVSGQCDVECDTAPNAEDFSALRDLYCATNGDEWINNSGWKEAITEGGDCNYCEWYGVECDDDGRVFSIDLDGDASFSQLNNGGNALDGQIPRSIGRLTMLENLFLGHNSLEGEVPYKLLNLPNLKYVSLSNNELSGVAPNPSTEDYSCMEELNISHNQMTDVSALESWCLAIERVDISHNNFSGPLPEIIAFDCDFSENNFSGTLENISTYNFIEKLNLSGNQLTGNIPVGFASFQYLQSLNLSENKLSGCFPQSLIALCNGVLITEGNKLMPWEGTTAQFCSTTGFEFQQDGAPCDDGIPSNGQDIIDPNCNCGQSPMIGVGTKWTFGHFENFPPVPGDSLTDNFTITGVENIDDKEYFILDGFQSCGPLATHLRIEDRRYYARVEGEEHLIHDFNLIAGDTLVIDDLIGYDDSETVSILIDSIGTTTIDGVELHTQFCKTLDEDLIIGWNLTFVENVGSLGFILPQFSACDPLSGPLKCISYGSGLTLIFTDHGICDLVLDTSTPLQNAVRIYPNPVADQLTIDTDQQILETIVRDLNGRVVDHKRLDNSISIGDLSSGLYMLSIRTKAGITTQKVLKM